MWILKSAKFNTGVGYIDVLKQQALINCNHKFLLNYSGKI